MTTSLRAGRRHAGVGTSGCERTVQVMLATCLGVVPLCALFTDIRWLADAYIAIAVVLGTAALLRYWQRPHVWHTWCGVAVLIPWLTWRFVPQHALGGVLPTGASFSDVSELLTRVHNTTRSGVAPVHADAAITFVLAAISGLLAAFIDLVAVVGRRPALAGVPLLVVFTVSGAVPRHPVSWVLFAVAATGFLLLLSIDAHDEVREWGRIIPRAGDARPAAALGVSGPRIAVVAVAIAVVIPLIVPARPSNLLANALHNSAGGGNGGIGTAGVSLDPFAALKGELQRGKPVNLFTVTVSQSSGPPPFYLRANVLDVYTKSGWRVGSHNGTENINSTVFNTDPATTQSVTTDFTATINITGLSDNPPVFARPIGVEGVNFDTSWSQVDELLVGSTVSSGQHLTEQISQPNPTIADLTASPAQYPASVRADLAVDPTLIRPVVRNLVAQIIGAQSSAYGKARALNDFFTKAANQFTYSLQTKAGDSGNALADFLTNRSGYCQQFAAAMGIMLRIAGVPARVVLGYTHSAAGADGTFTVTSDNAHAWTEAFFAGIGWIPFDPTPIASIAGAATTDLAWAPHPASSGGALESPTVRANRGAPSLHSTARPVAANAGPSSSAHRVPWQVVWVLVGLLGVAGLAGAPASIRWRRRRRRLRAARRGDLDPLWSELSDTATDLGYVWSPARTTRQVVDWLAGDLGRQSAQSLQTLAAAVERSRYSHPGNTSMSPLLVAELKDVESRLRSRRSTPTRIKARLLPASLGWRVRLTRRATRRH